MQSKDLEGAGSAWFNLILGPAGRLLSRQPNRCWLAFIAYNAYGVHI